MRITQSIEIAAPLEQVFEQWTDVERYHEWSPAVIDRQKLTRGPVGVGTRFRAVDQWPGYKAEFEMEITAYQKHELFGARWFKPMEGAWIGQFTATTGGTRLDFDIELRPPLLIRFLSPLFRRWAERTNYAFMVSFKESVEQTVMHGARRAG
jgi:uncharacterized protein YndB with AHSA1/START domain